MAAVLLLVACSGGDTHLAKAFLTVTPGRLDFGAGAARLPLELRNDGGATLTVSSLEVVDDPQAQLSVERGPFDLAAGASRTVTIGFVPGQLELHATLRLHSNADNAPERDVPVTGASGETNGQPDGGTVTPDGGTVAPDGCELELGVPTEVAHTASSVADLAFATGPSGTTLGWWTDDRDLGVRALDGAATPTGNARTVFHADASRFPVGSLSGAADAAGPLFFATEETAFAKQLHRVDLRGASAAHDQLDADTDIVSLAATPRAGGVAALWRRTGAQAGVEFLLDAGATPFVPVDTGLPSDNTFAHGLVAQGAGFVVTWHGTTGGQTPISGARLDGEGKLVAGSVKTLSSGGTKNVRPVPVLTTAGLVVAWLQDAGGSRRAAATRLSEGLAALDGDLELGVQGPSGTVAGSLAAAAAGDVAIVAWTRVSSAGVPQGLAVAGVDRRTGRVLATRTLDVAALAPYVDLAVAPVAAGAALAWTERSSGEQRVQVALVRCR